MKFLLPLLLVGCATMTPEEREEAKFQRDYKYAIALEKFTEKRDACHAAGMIWVTRFHDNKRKKPNYHELRSARCVSSVDNFLL